MKKRLAAVAAGLILATVSACGGAGQSNDPGSKGEDAPAAKAPSKNDPLTKENFVERISAAQIEAGSAHMSSTLGGTGAEMKMSGVVEMSEDLKKSKSQLTMDMGTGKMEVRLVDGMLYLSMGEMTGNKFIKVDLSDSKDPLASEYGALADQADPEAQLKVFRDALVKFDNQGKDGGTIDGVETTRIVMVLDTRKVLKSQGLKDQDSDKAMAQMPKELEYVLYIGPDDLMRRMVMNVKSMETTIDWTKWGEPISVKAPSKDQITDSSGLLGGSLGG